MSRFCLIRLSVFLISVFILNTFFIDSYRVVGNSMKPTYVNGDLLLVNKFFSDLEYNDNIIFQKDGIYYVKRIIGLPGDRLEYKDGALYVNGLIEKDIFSDGDDFVTQVCYGYYVLGDNRVLSKDSRSFGEVKKEEIVGKVILRYLNLDFIMGVF